MASTLYAASSINNADINHSPAQLMMNLMAAMAILSYEPVRCCSALVGKLLATVVLGATLGRLS